MNWQDLQEEWERRYKVYKEANAKYDEIIDKYFRKGMIEAGGRIKWEGDINVTDEKALEEIKEVIRIREEVSNNLDEIEQKMFG